MTRMFFQTIPICALLLVLAACSDPGAVNEANPLYQRGLDAAREGRYDYAVRCFRTCLQRSPESYKAHLQLAMIYETHLHKLPLAISHYETYLDIPQADGMLNVRKLLERAKRKYYKELKNQYEPLTPASASAVSVRPDIDVAALPEPVRSSPVEGHRGESSSAASRSPKRKTYTVRSGDNLSLISRRVYGSARHAHKLYEANRVQLQTPDRLKPGQELIIPPLSEAAALDE